MKKIDGATLNQMIMFIQESTSGWNVKRTFGLIATLQNLEDVEVVEVKTDDAVEADPEPKKNGKPPLKESRKAASA